MQLTTVVTAHGEGLLLRPTLRSISQALERVAGAGVECELLIQLDTASESTRSQAQTWAARTGRGFSVRVVESSTGDAGSARNAGIAGARGEYIALCDGDDLVSADYLLDGLVKLREAAVPSVMHPETLISFGARPSRWFVRPSTDPTVTFRDLIGDNVWPSSSIAHRSVFEEHPYPRLAPGGGFGPEDWTWNLVTAAAGVLHDVVERSVFFYRTRPSGGVNNQHTTSLVPPIDFDALRERYPVPPAPVIAPPSGARGAAQRAVRRAKGAAKWALSPLPRSVKNRLRRLITRPPSPAPLRDRREIESYLLDAAQIEPALSWHVHNYEKLEAWIPQDGGFGSVLDELLTALSGRSEALVMVPWIGIGGADLVSQNYLRLIQSSDTFAGKVSVLATYLPERSLAEMVPEGVNFVQANQSMRALSPERQHRLFAQAVVWAGPRLVVGVNCFDLVQSLGKFHVAICQERDVYMTLFAFDRLDGGYPVSPITDDAQRAFLSSISGLITDNSATKATVDEMLGLDPGFLRIHRQPALEPTPVLRQDTSAFNDEGFDEAHPFRLVWPHRLDGEKRPTVLIEIAKRARAEQLPIAIDVYGQRVLASKSSNLLDDFKELGIDYKGPYSGGLSALPTTDYHALLLTSAWEGLPLVLVQSMMLGLPVISTAVGGVPDLVEHGQTGMLVDGPDDIDGFMNAIRILMESREDRRRIIGTGYDFALANHSWEEFRAMVAKELDLEFRDDARAAPVARTEAG